MDMLKAIHKPSTKCQTVQRTSEKTFVDIPSNKISTANQPPYILLLLTAALACFRGKISEQNVPAHGDDDETTRPKKESRAQKWCVRPPLRARFSGNPVDHTWGAQQCQHRHDYTKIQLRTEWEVIDSPYLYTCNEGESTCPIHYQQPDANKAETSYRKCILQADLVDILIVVVTLR